MPEKECEVCGGRGFTLIDDHDKDGNHIEREMSCECTIKDIPEDDDQVDYEESL